ncbi:uncharacterized protein LOC131614691 [Vicia villosa]|uniref:uncharacterized protein LOC131614691 n=1 Tax=Vicia villosa TaxID=3911 RepID=UPI00273CACAF|nr:uncharacterized protein LOC131614691 [Vicia villosa]
MIIVSYNIKGGGSRLKRKSIGHLIQQEDVDVCFIQESKLRELEIGVVKELRGSDLVEWSSSDAVGASGGILILWKKDLFIPLFSFRGLGFLGLCVSLKGKRTFFINGYAPCELSARRRSWSHLLDIKKNCPESNWCVGGDFNSISHVEERRGLSNRNSIDINSFKSFLEDLDLVDPPVVGGKFSWQNSNGKAMSRIDRFLLSESLMEDWKVGAQEWSLIKVKGRGDFCLAEKLKALKVRLSWWNKTVYGWLDLKINEACKEIHFLDNEFVVCAGNVTEEIVKKRAKEVEIFWDSLSKKEGLLRLKSRQTWLKEGDCNSRFFHNSLRSRKGRSALCSLNSRSGIVEEVEEVKDFVFNHFKGFFEEEEGSRPVPLDLGFVKLSREDRELLEGPFEEEEVIGKLVSSNQSAFVPGRNMMDGVVLVNEILEWSKRFKKSCFLLKVDFEKAYDSVSWDYVRFVLKEMGFGDKWLRWMDESVFKSFMSILVNGSPTKDFEVHKGLRQGDPLSPFLFVLVMEGLTALVRKSVELGDFKPIKYGEGGVVDIL